MAARRVLACLDGLGIRGIHSNKGQSLSMLLLQALKAFWLRWVACCCDNRVSTF